MDSSPETGSAGLPALYYLYPAVVFLYFNCSSLASVCTLKRFKDDDVTRPETASRSAVLALLALCVFSCAAQLTTYALHAFAQKQWPREDHLIVGTFSSLLIFGMQASVLSDHGRTVGHPFVGSWFLALAFETAIAILSARAILSNHASSRYDMTELMLVGLRVLTLTLLIASPRLAPGPKAPVEAGDEERQSLLAQAVDGDQARTTGKTQYGAAAASDQASVSSEFAWERIERETLEARQRRLKQGGNWFEYAKEFMVRAPSRVPSAPRHIRPSSKLTPSLQLFFPYIWPVGNRSLQLHAAGVVLCIFASNALHLLIPRQTGIIMDSLSGTNSTSPWIAVIVFAALRLAASETGIELLRQRLWIPVKYYSRDSISRAAYSHIMHLSADFHDSKSSSDMMSAIFGGTALSSVVENILLQAAPMLIDMCVAIVYLSVTFGPYEGLITVVTGATFFLMASRFVAISKAGCRKRIHALYQESNVRHAGLLGWQTVSAFNQIGYEDNRHANSVTNRWLHEKQYAISRHMSVAFQTMVLTCGLLVSAFLAVSRIQTGKATSGQFAMLLMYWAQLTSPLQFFARLAEDVSDEFIDAETLLHVMQTKPTVENKKGARPLKFVAGNVDFQRVSFSYNGQKETIKNISLNVAPGEKVAFVGSTGAGKSTMLRLLGRFYDLALTPPRSLRDRIGIVPQNPILFDDTIMNNVRYGRITASDEEVFEACKAACIHDKIKDFTNGYDARVGERGVKLSGGELQRVAIARAILKKPDIVLLDEATSAVDTDTEQNIQKSFGSLCRGRTTFIVAHRLSTIMNADRIVVVEHGELIEQGSHQELVAAGGRYADLWSKQVFLQPHGKANDVAKFIDDRPDPAADASASAPTTVGQGKGEAGGGDGGEMVRTEMGQAREECKAPQQRAREGYKLNPVAPEFTPRELSKSASEGHNSLPGAVGTSDNVGDVAVAASLPASQQWSDDVTGVEPGEGPDSKRNIASPGNEGTRVKMMTPVGEAAEHGQVDLSDNDGIGPLTKKTHATNKSAGDCGDASSDA
ncbi:heavy metal tolerance protein [Drechmeria coniospora]|uniref:Heavy metal tolerance protein n=1 Tax=Drechmeria coniospora TaxID=98403 RepID=A0A151GBR7_DRECN|nr:heavy metal tolerance protein [Drechmeria coniospora]KYK54491.1 heavy metal tolerance protein [Drechmeria coniospora]